MPNEVSSANDVVKKNLLEAGRPGRPGASRWQSGQEPVRASRKAGQHGPSSSGMPNEVKSANDAVKKNLLEAGRRGRQGAARGQEPVSFAIAPCVKRSSGSMRYLHDLRLKMCLVPEVFDMRLSTIQLLAPLLDASRVNNTWIWVTCQTKLRAKFSAKLRVRTMP